MENIIDLAKKKLSCHFTDHGAELVVLEYLLSESGEHRMELLKWVMKDKKIGFIEPRKIAGLEFVKEDPIQGWKILEELILSNNPDDRDTAFEILEELNNPRSFELIKNLLIDEYPSLQFEACDYLSEAYPQEVIMTLEMLSKHSNKTVSEAAVKRLSKYRNPRSSLDDENL